jgi:undecaprenyl-diphosphatase
VLIPALVGGSWAQDLSVSTPESLYLAFIVIGAVQVFALLPGISWDGIATVTGMFRGLAPFATYCLIAGLGSLAWFAIR